MLAALGDFLAQRDTGLLATIDELHVSEVGEIREFGSVFRLVSRRVERPIAFVGAALPERMDDEALTIADGLSVFAGARPAGATDHRDVAAPSDSKQPWISQLSAARRSQHGSALREWTSEVVDVDAISLGVDDGFKLASQSGIASWRESEFEHRQLNTSAVLAAQVVYLPESLGTRALRVGYVVGDE